MDEKDKAVVARSVKDVHKALGMWSIRRALAMAFSGAAVLLVAAWFLVSWLLGSPPRTKAKPLDTSAQLDLLKLVFALVAGIGALVALVTAYRRQRIEEVAGERAERIQAHAEQVARDNAHDATERRVTDLYGKAVEQLGHDKAAVRLGGLYALERLAQDHLRHRQTIVDVICGYLRMPFHYTAPTTTTTPQPEQAIQNLPPETHKDGQRQELQVRLTAQRILARLLRIKPPTAIDPSPIYPDSYWDEIDLDLTGAHLIDLDLTDCLPHDANFHGAQFSGDAWFDGARFGGVAWFREAQFGRHAEFRGARFGVADFREARFGGDAGFREAQFSKDARFDKAQFGGGAVFGMAQFGGDAGFREAQFSKDARFDKAQFEERPVFVGAAAGLPADQHLWPQGWRTDPPAPDHDMAPLVYSSDGASR